MRRKLIVAGAAVFLCAAAVVTYIAVSGVDTTFEFRLEDSVSRRWVWDSTIRLQDRLAFEFYQGDTAPVPLTFTHLRPGPATLQISAPGYVPVSLPLTLRRGSNRLDKPIEVVGYEIPDLDHFVVFEQLDGGDIVAELRPVGKDSHAVLNHPCLNIWVGARMTVELRDGAPVAEHTDSGWTRGREIFSGRIDWDWNPAPGVVFRYHARIPGASIVPDPALYRVIDYLIVVPDPRSISARELDALMSSAPPLSDLSALKSYLRQQGSRISFFFDTSANVKGREE